MKLFEPIHIGKMEVKNRLVMAPMSVNLSREGFVTQQMIRFYEERAKGGVGLITVEDGIVEVPRGNNVKEAVGIDSDDYIPLLAKLCEKFKAFGVKSLIQLSHGGRRAGRVYVSTGYLEVTRGMIPVAPSSIPHPVPGYVVPSELTVEQIEDIVNKFGLAAGRAIEAGFDAVGLHCAHMYLCGEFLSPWANKRLDKYGKDFDGRLRFVLEVVAKIRSVIGADYPIICRINGSEPEGGNSIEDICRIAQRLEESGVDAIHVSTGFGVPIKALDFIPSVTPMRFREGCIVPLTEKVKKVVNIPVIAVNRIRDINFAERILQENKADLIAMGRPLLADPELPQKAKGGRFDDIRPCISCCECIRNVVEKDLPVVCAMNPVAGREGTLRVEPAKDPRKILVIGGGPAGFEVALSLVKRGHRVTLCEKENELGGQLLVAKQPPGKSELSKVVQYYEIQAKKYHVNVVLGKEVTVETLGEIKPDVVILATGSRPLTSYIPGRNQNNTVNAQDILRGKVKVGGNIVIIGGGQVGAETAEYLAEKGKKVRVIEMMGAIATDMPNVSRLPLLASLENYGVEIITNAEAEEIKKEGVVVKKKGKKEIIPADTVVLALGSEPNRELLSKIKEKFPNLSIYIVGDTSKPGKIIDAIHSAFEVGLRI
jgi:2,4-dienoyl-CoA reductase (NADPH2)